MSYCMLFISLRKENINVESRGLEFMMVKYVPYAEVYIMYA